MEQKLAYQHAMACLYARLPFYQRQGKKAVYKSLDNIKALCQALGDPQNKYPSIHIAGTNGKGTTACSLAHLLTQAGFRTGLYTSPHLSHFSERIQINGRAISETSIISYVQTYKVLIDRISPSFFEISCAMAFDHFAAKGVDIAIIETGLGGKWDSTNIIQPLFSLITNISYDHQDMLGSTLQQIAQEKAGIIKKKTPLILGTIPKTLRPIFATKAATCGASLAGSDYYSIKIVSESVQERVIDIYRHGEICHPKLKLSMVADYYLQNLPLILTAAEYLQKLGFRHTKKQLRASLSTFEMRGRFQLLSKSPITRCDIAHNAAGLQALFKQVARLHKNGTWHIIFGLSKEKINRQILAVLPKQARYYVTQSQTQRACEAKLLTHHMKAQKLESTAYESLSSAWEIAHKNAEANDLILCCGSAYLVGELPYFAEQNQRISL